MAKINLGNILKSTKRMSVKNAPWILTTIGIVGMACTIVEAVRETPKALEKIDEKKREIFDEMNPEDIPGNMTTHEDIKLTKKEVIQCTWKLYLRAAITGVASTACIIASDKISVGRTAAALSMYDIAQKTLKEYQDNTLKIVGPEKEEEIRQEVVKKHFEPAIVDNIKPIITGSGDTLCYDVLGDRYFMSDRTTLREQILDVNERMLSGYEERPSLNEVYSAWRLPATPFGDVVGWDVQHTRKIVPRFTARFDDNGRLCMDVDFEVRPNRDYLNRR